MKLALISMPWAIFNRPSIQLGTLKGYLRQRIEIDVAKAQLCYGVEMIFHDKPPDQKFSIKPDVQSLDLGVRFFGHKFHRLHLLITGAENEPIFRRLGRKIIKQISCAGKKSVGDIGLQLLCRGDDHLVVLFGCKWRASCRH